MAKYRQQLHTWLQEAMNNPDKGQAITVSLFHMKASSGGTAKEEVHSTKITGQATALQIANLMNDKAEMFAGGFTGTQTFRVVVLYEGDSPDDWKASYPMIIRGAIEHDGLATEAPSKDGMVSQMMRHNEALMAQSFQLTTKLFERMDRQVESYQRQIDLYADSNEKLRQETVEAWELAKKLVVMQEETDHNHRMKELEYERSTEERAKFMKLLPGLANTAFGKEIIPQSTVDSEILETILSKVSPEQLTMVGQFLQLSPEMMAPLITRAADLAIKRKKEQEEEEQGKVLAMGAGDG